MTFRMEVVFPIYQVHVIGVHCMPSPKIEDSFLVIVSTCCHKIKHVQLVATKLTSKAGNVQHPLVVACCWQQSCLVDGGLKAWRPLGNVLGSFVAATSWLWQWEILCVAAKLPKSCLAWCLPSLACCYSIMAAERLLCMIMTRMYMYWVSRLLSALFMM